MAQPRSGGRGESFGDWLERMNRAFVEGQNPTEFSNLLAEAQQHDLEAIGFRKESLKTQQKQDRHLALYRNFIRILKECDDNIANEDLDRLCFPAPDGNNNFRTMFSQIRAFLGIAVRKATPQNNDYLTVSYAVPVGFRSSFLFWIPRKYDEQNLSPPSSRKVYSEITEMCQFLAREYKLRVNPTDKPYIGPAEILQLIDLDTRLTPCIELAECHHLAWCIARCCALRPGSFGQQAHKVDPNVELPFLAFRDLRITRGSTKGDFTVRLVIRNLKTNTLMDAERAFETNKKLVFTIKSPKQIENLALSVPHRLLVLALRRGALKDMETIDDVLNGQMHYIEIKQGFMDKPVLLTGGPRGHSVDTNRPLTSNALNDYLKLRGDRLGYYPRLNFYAIRRQSATDLTIAIGREAARAIMSHEPNSRTLERYYVNLNPTTDLTAIATGEEPNTEEMQVDSAEIALYKMTPEQVAKNHGPALNALVNQMIAEDPDYPLEGTLAQRKNRDRVHRRTALKTLMTETHQELKTSMTQAEYQERRKNIVAKATDFNKRLVEQARANIQDSAMDDSSTDADDVDYDTPFPEEANLLPETEPDAEDQYEDGSEILITEEEGLGSAYDRSGDIPYHVAVKTAMEMMLNNGLSETPPAGAMLECPLCLEDDTIGQAEKNRTWPPARLKRHMESKIHAKSAVFWRKLNSDFLTDDGYTCCYCSLLGFEGESLAVYTRSGIWTHINNSDAHRISGGLGDSTSDHAIAHDELKAADGWYDDDFHGSVEVREKRKSKDAEFFKHFLPAPFMYSDEQELPRAKAVGGQPMLQHGAFSDLTAHAQNFSRRLDTIPTEQLLGTSLVGGAYYQIPARFTTELDYVDLSEDSSTPYVDELNASRPRFQAVLEPGPTLTDKQRDYHLTIASAIAKAYKPE